jgi:hypothetical protein
MYIILIYLQVTYNFKLKIESSSGEPINSDCECPAGKGPNATCKHIASILLMLVHFKETGLVQISKSCTENLQMFHKPKSTYKGIPMFLGTLFYPFIIF